MENQTFIEVELQRVETKQPDESIVVSFQRVRIIKEMKITPAEVDMLNAGKLTSPGNIQFTYILKPGEDDPEPITLASSKPAIRKKSINN